MMKISTSHVTLAQGGTPPARSFLGLAALMLSSVCTDVSGFAVLRTPSRLTTQAVTGGSSSPSALNVWWFGGTESSELNQDNDSCELVAVRIERTSSNSRKIAGSISVPTPLDDVWAILTDYNRLAIHVPNLVESKIVSQQSRGEQGDGSFRCRLFQKGAQKIIGFEFGASLTMEMTEKIITSAADSTAGAATPQERMIGFKCVDSFFFTEFDGEWRAKEQLDSEGNVETVLDYVVDVRPKGPVPVAALEWRIREDVPTNLRAVKKAAIDVGQEGVLASRKRVVSPSRRRIAARSSVPETATAAAAASNEVRQPRTEITNAIRRATVRRPPNAVKPLAVRNGQILQQPASVVASRTVENVNKQQGNESQTKPKKTPLPFRVTWEADETMAAYLTE